MTGAVPCRCAICHRTGRSGLPATEVPGYVGAVIVTLRHTIARSTAGLLLSVLLAAVARAQAPASAWVYPSPAGDLLYQLDTRGQRIADHSACGYGGGIVPLPDVAALIPTSRWVRVSPGAGDDRALVQAAIDAVEAMTPDAGGWRGVVSLAPGEYQVGATLNINAGGVVLKGAGASATTGTRLRATATNQYNLIAVSGSGSRTTVAGTTHDLTQKLVPAGARTFQVDATDGLAAGDTVLVYWPSTAAWIADNDMDQLDLPWTPGSKDLHFDRVITRIDGNWITVDAPLTQTFESKYDGGKVWRYTWPGRIAQVGIEDLYGFSDYVSSTDEDHGWKFIQINSAMHVWVRNITARYFGYSAVSVGGGAKWVTVADSQCLDPVSVIDGGRRYSFNNEGAELTLFVNNYARKGRHDFVFGASVEGPNVFVHGSADTVYSDSGPHHRWTVGGLFDNLVINGDELNIRNRGNSGTGHGWAGAYCAVWNCAASTFRVRNPPTARNWLVGSAGAIGSNSGFAVGADPAGTYDQSGTSSSGVRPRSLYYAQLQQRLKWPGSVFREAWLGDVDQHYSTGGAGNTTDCDAAWLAQVQAASGSADTLFDYLVGNRHTAFTFNVGLDPGDMVVAASLTLGLRAAGGLPDNDILRLDSTTNVLAMADLGWNPVPSTGPVVRTTAIDPGLLADGRLNVAVGDDLAVDFAVLHFQVQPALPPVRTVSLAPVADAFVRGGAYAAVNYGANATVDIKDVSDSDVHREAFFRWDLSGQTGRLVQAKVRLHCTATSQTGNEGIVSPVADDAWGESTLTYQNRPAAGRFFAHCLPVTGQFLEFIVTPHVEETLLGDDQLSLKISAAAAFGSLGNVSYAARENANASLRPQLILVFENRAPTASPFSDHIVDEDAVAGPIPLHIDDVDSGAGGLVVSTSSSHSSLLPETNIVVIVATNAWISTDLGAVAVAGSSAPGDLIVMRASGADIWNAADEGHFLQQPLTGDGDLVARVTGLTPTDPWAKAGVMMRAGLDAGSINAYMAATVSNGVTFQRRLTNGGTTAYTRVAGIATPCWVRLSRSGTNVAGYYAADQGGSPGAWTQVGATTGINLGGSPVAGLAGTAHNDGAICTSTYDHVSGPGFAGGNRALFLAPAPDQHGTATVAVVVGDGQLAVTQRFHLIVRPVNDAPVLAALANRALGVGQWLVVTNRATDVDLPAQPLTFSLAVAPAGAVVGATNGLLTWRPTVAQAGTGHLFQVRVADGGMPVLTATRQFTAVVHAFAAPVMAPPTVAGGRLLLAIDGDAGPDYAVQVSTNLVQWSVLFATNAPALPILWTDTGASNYQRRFYRVLPGP